MRKSTDSNPKIERKYDPPKAPRINVSLAQAYKIDPYVLYATEDTLRYINEQEQLALGQGDDIDTFYKRILQDKNNVVVGVGQLTAKHMYAYEQKNNKRSVQDTWTILSYYQAWSAGAFQVLPDGFYYNEETMEFHVHIGSVYGSYASNVLRFAASMLSLIGRLVDTDPRNMQTGGFVIEPIDVSTVENYLNFDNLMSPTIDANGKTVRSEYERILTIIGLIKRPTFDVDNTEPVIADDPKALQG